MPINTLTDEPAQTEWLSVREAATYLGVGMTFLRQQIYAGTVPSYRFGNRHKIRASDLAAWAESQRYEPSA